jgi:hypothetical protein
MRPAIGISVFLVQHTSLWGRKLFTPLSDADRVRLSLSGRRELINAHKHFGCFPQIYLRTLAVNKLSQPLERQHANNSQLELLLRIDARSVYFSN